VCLKYSHRFFLWIGDIKFFQEDGEEGRSMHQLIFDTLFVLFNISDIVFSYYLFFHIHDETFHKLYDLTYSAIDLALIWIWFCKIVSIL